ncbi:putative membrane protein [Methylobacterium sp. BE186]|uniref:hypothetical protein n=1 Tax=Methylobacterium sp. BE186 TaxID=2817715 RepID=UPI0028629723|nr:hypothetical protein [Methylobacterium sp. BE186]MDR7040159.1 putative membrane protein [Methylobacterium sp. BE186]
MRDAAMVPAFPGTEAPGSADGRTRRAVMLGLAVAAVLAVLAAGGGAADTEPDLLRLVRFMAALKGAFALAALVACFWRLRRPALPWRQAVYVVAPALMAGGALALWQVQLPGLAAILLHAGLFGFLAAALTDADFLEMPVRRLRQAAGGRERRLSPTE